MLVELNKVLDIIQNVKMSTVEEIVYWLLDRDENLETLLSLHRTDGHKLAATLIAHRVLYLPATTTPTTAQEGGGQ